MVKIAVIGAGINGVTCALKIKEKYKEFDVVLISKDFSPNTTGDGSGGLWYPYLCGNTPEHLLTKWGGETYEFLHKLWIEGGHNVSLVPVYALYRQDPQETRPGWASVVCGYQDLDRSRLEYLSRLYAMEYVSGHTFTTYVVQPPRIISYLYKRFISAGGRVISASVTSLQDSSLAGCAVVVNCTGLGARTVVPDEGVFPVRGQVFKAIVPWLNEVVIDQDSCHYIIPNAETCVLGGTHQNHDYNTKEDKNDTDHILNGCRSMIPGLKHAKIVDTWVGLRPGRDAVRLEAEEKDGRLYIHNYGHGGSGLTLFWGCGTQVLQLLKQHIKNTEPIKSKL
ncbi:D-amino-acid oxidase isoform X1 [Pectinophora gossypiella]|uniref:D-amino-acid oxidase isoform X1 n=1 Tax=Pectinophora gossypiella TaxID=13191 RepID=UPI00214E3EE2|nr:D-amino-acid oxidase isoform X1 [Pectinophora gossypiella]